MMKYISLSPQCGLPAIASPPDSPSHCSSISFTSVPHSAFSVASHDASISLLGFTDSDRWCKGEEDDTEKEKMGEGRLRERENTTQKMGETRLKEGEKEGNKKSIYFLN
ncbi:hypothetical protein LOK49_LG10G01534 [Camellia lanceoleosa]|uniref:Uncharacterized protein n=1 Tax=Camellia lanceoleosa TaxID=1840588 RepID=A0ACC0G8N4_9ERIC|nr:hypothetical protein LOK49_LG10G01534 [Camellia lanceoleosa]